MESEHRVDVLLTLLSEGHSLIMSGLDHLDARKDTEAASEFESAAETFGTLQARIGELGIPSQDSEIQRATLRSIDRFLECARTLRDAATHRDSSFADRIARARVELAEGQEYFNRAGELARHMQG